MSVVTEEEPGTKKQEPKTKNKKQEPKSKNLKGKNILSTYTEKGI